MFLKNIVPLGLLAVLLLLPPKAVAQIYADVQVASTVPGTTGTFTITLEHQKIPGAVANFIGLATGQRGWLDLNTGAIRYDGFYNGVTFHRVVKNFVSQAGSRNGLGTDGPGYTFRDEIDPTLSHVNYAVAMANSGINTNGSQFYVCRGSQPFLDGKYTVFGLVTAGQAICDAINDTTINGTPAVPITIQSVNIYGPSLAAFDRDPAWLPKLRNAKPVLMKSGATFTLGYERLPHSEYNGWHSTNFVSWAKFTGSYFGDTAPATDIDVSTVATGPSHFYRLARVDYSTAKNPFMPSGVGGRSFTFTSNFFPTSVAFNTAGDGGTWTLQTTPTAGSGTISTVTYSLLPYNYTASLFMKWNSTATYGFDIQLLYKLNYTSANAGTFTGQSNVSGYTNNIVGTFTTLP